MRIERPRAGDVLISRPTATLVHEICVVPTSPHIVCPSRDEAMAQGRQLAGQLEVDAWLTEDHIHFLWLGSFRSEGEARPAASDVGGRLADAVGGCR